MAIDNGKTVEPIWSMSIAQLLLDFRFGLALSVSIPHESVPLVLGDSMHSTTSRAFCIGYIVLLLRGYCGARHLLVSAFIS